MRLKQLLVLLVSVLVLTACQKAEVIDPVPETPQANDTVQTPADAPQQEIEESVPADPEPEQIPDVPDEDVSQPEPVVVTVYSGNDNADGFVTAQIELVELTPDALLLALTEAGSVPDQTICRSFAQSDDGKTLTLDISQTFADGIMQMGTSGEAMMLGSLVNTFLLAYGAEELFLTVEGAHLETGHNVYDFPLGFFGQKKELCAYPKAP